MRTDFVFPLYLVLKLFSEFFKTSPLLFAKLKCSFMQSGDPLHHCIKDNNLLFPYRHLHCFWFFLPSKIQDKSSSLAVKLWDNLQHVYVKRSIDFTEVQTCFNCIFWGLRGLLQIEYVLIVPGSSLTHLTLCSGLWSVAWPWCSLERWD